MPPMLAVLLEGGAVARGGMTPPRAICRVPGQREPVIGVNGICA